MRFSRNREAAQASVKYTLRYGPLLALSADLAELLSKVDSRGAATHLELDYLAEASTLLSQDDAHKLFIMLSDEFKGLTPPLEERWTVPWGRRESVAKLLGRL